MALFIFTPGCLGSRKWEMSCHLFSCCLCPISIIKRHTASWLMAWSWASDRSVFETRFAIHWQCDDGLIKPGDFGHVGYDRYFPGLVLASIFFLCVWVCSYKIYNTFVLLLLLTIISWKSFLISPEKSTSIFLTAAQYCNIRLWCPLLTRSSPANVEVVSQFLVQT